MALKFQKFIDSKTDKEVLETDIITELYKEFMKYEDRKFEEDGFKTNIK